MGRRPVSMAAVAICLLSLMVGCSLHVVPSEIPRLDTKTESPAGPFNNITVTLVNAQPDDSNYSIKSWKGTSSGYELNRKLWTEKLVEALGAELAARRGRVATGAPVTISLKITEVIYPRYVYGKVLFDATASVTSNSGWTKTYVGKGDGVAFRSKAWNYAASWVITDLVRVMMSDREFVAELGRQR